MNYQKCYHCGAEYGLHQSETENCPMGGVEETREGKKQQWAASTFLEDKVRRLEVAAPQLLSALQDCVRYFEQHRNGGCNGEGKKHETGSCYEKAITAIKIATA